MSHSFNQGLNGVDFDLSVPEHCLGDELMHAVRHLVGHESFAEIFSVQNWVVV